MFTSSRFAPPRTCSSATSTAPVKSPPSIRRRKRAEPVTFVRSPISTKPVSAPISNGSRPLKRGAGAGAAGPAAATSPRTAAAIARVCSGVEPQHEPTMFRKPVARELVQQRRRHVGRLVVAAERVRQARRSGAHEVRHVAIARQLGDVRPHLARAERAVDADDQRVGVLDRRPEASIVCPLSVRPERSTIVTLIQSGNSGATSRAATIAAFAFSVSKIVSISSRSTPPSASAADLLGVGLDDLLERVRAVAGVVDARAERERDVERADRAGDEAVGAGGLARDARAGDVHLVDGVLEPVVRLADRRRRERVRRRDVGAGGEVGVVHLSHDVGPRQVEQVGVVQEVAPVAREALAAEVGLVQAAVLEQHPPRPVEHEDALGCEPCDLLCGVARVVAIRVLPSLPKEDAALTRARAL